MYTVFDYTDINNMAEYRFTNAGDLIEFFIKKFGMNIADWPEPTARKIYDDTSAITYYNGLMIINIEEAHHVLSDRLHRRQERAH